MSGPSPVETPIGWRVCVQPTTVRPFDREFRPKPRYTVHATLAEAEAEKERQRAHFGDHAAIHVQPMFAPPRARERERRARQESLTAAGWPIQMRPPRPGMPDKKRRRK
jgi:hypothetical protein